MTRCCIIESVNEAPVCLYLRAARNFLFTQVPIRLDYHGQNVNMEQGTLANLIVGLAQLNHSQLTLKKLHNRQG